MRAGWVGLVLLGMGCATTGSSTPTTITVTTSRVAMAGLPSSPMGLSGAPGIGIGAKVTAGVPQKQVNGGGVAFPVVQPELAGVLQLGERTWIGARFEVATPALGVHVPAGSPRFTGDELAFLGTFGVAHDVPLGSVFNLVGGLDVGFSQTTLVASSPIHAQKLVKVEPQLSTALGLAAKLGDFRVYLVGGVGTHIWNNANSELTRTCDSFGTCVDVDTGVLATTLVGTVGAGVRWQPKPGLSVMLEGAVPISVNGTRLPPILSLSVRVGDAVVARPRPRPAAPPPPPVSPPPPPLPVETYPGP